MKTKTLSTIQTLSKIGRVLSKIVFIFCLIGAIGCAAGILSIKLLPESFQLGSVTIQGLVDLSEEISADAACAALVTGLIMFTGEAVLAKIAERCFRREIEAGTPFSFEWSRQLKRPGICAICIPIASTVAAEIVNEILKQVLTDVSDLNLADTTSVGLGIMMIVASLLCKYGAELTQARAE